MPLKDSIVSSGKWPKARPFFRQMTAFWKCCIWQPWISRKNGPGTGRTGGKSTPSLKSILKSVWLDATCKTSLFWAGFIDMPKNSCIMQIWAESGKSALPICNYSQILYQFLTFTQNLKRSHSVISDIAILFHYVNFFNIYFIKFFWIFVYICFYIYKKIIYDFYFTLR